MREKRVFLGTGITRNFVDRALPYLISLDAMDDNNGTLEKFVVTLGFYAADVYLPEYRKNLFELCPTVKFLRKEIGSLISANSNFCLQHGDFLSSLEELKPTPDDIVVYTDSDAIYQRDMEEYELKKLLSYELGDVGLAYNAGVHDNLLSEYERLFPYLANEKGEVVVINNYPQRKFTIHPDRLEEILNDDSFRRMKCYNTGMLVCTYETYQNIYSQYNSMWEKMCNITDHRAIQQWCINFILQAVESPFSYNIKLLDTSFHSHGHYGIMQYFKFKDGKLFINGYGKEKDKEVFFRHNIPYVNPRVLVHTPNNCGTAMWRITKPITELKKLYHGKIDFVVTDNINENMIALADVIVTHALYSSEIAMMIKRFKKKEAKWIVDIDDDLFDMNASNNGGKLKTDDFLIGFKSYGMNADIVTVTTKELADNLEGDVKYKDENGKKQVTEKFHRKDIGLPYVILPNSIDAEMWAEFYALRTTYYAKKRDNIIRIGYTAGSSHFEDAVSIIPVIIELMKKYDNLRFVFIGQFFQFKDIDTEGMSDRFEFIQWDALTKYPRNLIHIDIGIAPLLDNVFNISKSPIKWMEYAMLKIPCVMANIKPYKGVVRQDIDGYLASSDDDWINMLSALIEAPKLRAQIGDNAHKAVLEHHDIRKNIQKWIDCYGLDELTK